MILTVATPTADILGNPAEPDKISKNDSQLLYGEQFQVEESRGAYVYGHSLLDNYKGSVERAQLIKNAPASNIIVKAGTTHLYAEPSFKSRPHTILSFMSRLTRTEKTENNFTLLENGRWVFSDHIAPIKNFTMPEDLSQTATLFIGTPYLYGGRSKFGIDCSGLIQQIMLAHGHACPPRDCHEQQGTIGTSVDNKNLQRNDIVYFKGHVGIMLDDKYIFNATARHMSTVIEDVKDLEKIYDGITHVSRL